MKPLHFFLKLFFIGWLSTLVALSSARAHEVQPGILEFNTNGDTVNISLEWMIEAAVAGLNLRNLENTQDAENDGEYDRLRALEPDQMQAAFEATWPSLGPRISVMDGEIRLPLTLTRVDVPPVGNLDLPRASTVSLTATLVGSGALTIGWDPSLGPLVVRQNGIENGYAAFLTPGQTSDAIPLDAAVEQSMWDAFVDYVWVGFDHIVPQGLDHILFVLGLFFFSLKMGALLWQVTAFTLAHTVTLALGSLGLVSISPDIVEPIIAASIVYVGIENLFLKKLPPWRPFVIFGFGLLHGLGFASVLQDFGLGNDNFVPKLIGFNVGVEVGQLAVIAAAWVTLALFFGRFEWYHRRIAEPVSVAIALIAAFWVLERTGVVGTDGPWSLFSALTEGGFHPLWMTVSVLVIAAILTASEMLIITEDLYRELAGWFTSFFLFLGLVATFTSGAWTLCAIIAAAWVLALRLQSLGEPQDT